MSLSTVVVIMALPPEASRGRAPRCLELINNITQRWDFGCLFCLRKSIGQGSLSVGVLLYVCW